MAEGLKKVFAAKKEQVGQNMLLLGRANNLG